MASNIDPDQPVPSCPACDAKDPIVPHLDPLDTQDLSITLPSSRKTISFTDATRTYLKDHFPDLDKTTYRVPATLVYDRKGVLDLSTNEEVLSNETLGTARVSAKRAADEVVKDRFQKDAVEKVVQCFHSWGSEHGEGLLVLSEYNMQDYLRRAAKTGSKNRKTIDGEHDVMVIHLNTGVTFVQVKSVRNTKIKTKRERIEKAFKQIAKDEKAFRELNGDLVFIKRVPVVGFVALPELKRDHLSNTGLCDAHKGRVLTMEDLESTTEFNQWVENHLSNKQFKRRGTPSLGLENYIELCGRYVGLASVVQIRTLPEAVKKTSAMVGQILLTREQEEVIRAGNRLQVILGEYGTGKSLVLAKMAEKIVASGEGLDIVFVVSCTSVNQSMPTGKSNTRKPGSLLSSPSHLVSHFRSLFSEPMSPSFSIMSIRDLFQYCFPENANWNCECLSPVMMAKLTRKVISMHPKASVHMMWDEVPFISGWDWKPLKDLGKENPGTFMWVTIATGTYNTMISGEPVAYAKDKFRPNFEVLSLKKCMRMTRNGFRFYQALQTFLGNKGCCSTTSGNAVNGVVPRWYPLKNCFCESPCPLSSTCLHNRLTRTLKRIWRLLKNIDPSSVSFVCGDIDDRVNLALINAVKKACETLKIPADDLPTSDNDNQSTPETSENVASKPKKCNIVDSVSYRGCESPVVIIVSLRGTPFMMEFKGERHGWDDISPLISRALGQIIIITWSQRDIDQINSIFYSDMILSNRSSFPLPGSDERTEFLKTMIGKLDEILKVYSKKDGADYNSDSMLSSLETTTDEEELKEKVNKIVKTLGQQTHFLECLVKQNVIVKYGSPNINMSCCSL